MLRQNRPMAEIVREAVRAYVMREPRKAPPGAGAFASGRADTAERASVILAETGFGSVAAVEAGKRGAPCSQRPPRLAKSLPTMSVLLDTGIVYAYDDRATDGTSERER